MKAVIRLLTAPVSRWRLRRRFPLAVIHAGAMVDGSSEIGPYAVVFPEVRLLGSSLGRYSYVQRHSALYNTDVGPYCSIADDACIGLGAHPTTLVSTSPVFYDASQPLPRFYVKGCHFPEVLPRTQVGADVWIGHGAMIKAGICIGPGAIVGAGAVVTKNVLPYAIVVGNPCRQIRFRFSDDVCRRLVESRWWELDEARLERLVPMFSDPHALLAALAKERE